MDILLLTLNLQRDKVQQREENKQPLQFGMQHRYCWRLLMVATSPDSVAGTTVPPSTLNLLESINAALLPPEAAARPVDVVDPWFGVYCKV